MDLTKNKYQLSAKSNQKIKDDDQVNRIDYTNRKRNLEWREQWFHLGRSKNDRAYLKTLQKGLRDKYALINKFKDNLNHLGGYSPAGAGTPWFSIGPRNINGRVKSIAVHPTNEDIVYAGAASGGVWKSEDSGQSWRPLWNDQDTMSIGSIAIAPSSPTTIYAGTGEWTPGWGPNFPGTGMFVTTDGGSTWVQKTTVLARRIARVLVAAGDANTVYVAGDSGFEKSTDGGDTWTTVQSGLISDAVIDPTDDTVLYINVRNSGIYKSTDSGNTWDLLDEGPTGSDADWIRLDIGQSGTSGSNFIVAKRSGTIYKSMDGGEEWDTVAGTHGDATHHAWANLIAVAPDNEDILIAGGVGAKRSTDGGSSWSNLSGLHADHHRAIFAPSDTNIVYTCNDGGVYRSDDKGATWEKVSHGLVVSQFYDVGSWKTIGTVVGGGTQDQGTNMTTGGLTWKKIFGWDGGYFVVDPNDPRTIYAEHQNTDIHKSVDGGDNWVRKTGGLTGSNPWTGVITMDPNDPSTLFTGTTRIFRSTDGLATDWNESSQGLGAEVSSIAVAESDSDRVYCTTSGGDVFRSDDNGATSPWTDITNSAFPNRLIKDVVVDRTDKDRVLLCFGGTNGGSTSNHIWLSSDGGDTSGGWSDISNNLPNVSVNALAFDPNVANTFYAGTDVGVFRTTDQGATWHAFDNGIPNVVIVDLEVDETGNALIAATFGRGMYKISLSGATEPNVDVYLRDSVLDTGERFPSPSGQPNPNDVSDTVHWWESPDIKVDALTYYDQDALFDGVEFDELTHEDPKRTEQNRFYLQLHNRGWQNASNVKVRAFLADASAGLPALPNALVAPSFNLTSTADWTPIGGTQTVPLLEPNRPVVVSWDYTVPSSAATHSCLLAVISSDEDSYANSETNINALVKSEKKICLKNLHVVDSGGSAPRQQVVTINFNNALTREDTIDIIIKPTELGEGTIGLLLEPVEFIDERKALDGVGVYQLAGDEVFGEYYVKPGTNLNVGLQDLIGKIDTTRIYEFDTTKTSVLRGIKMKPGQKLQGLITTKGSKRVPYGQTQQFTVMQQQGREIVGGSTYELRLTRAAGLYPVSNIRIILEKVKILDDYEPWFKGKGDFQFMASVGFNADSCRTVLKHFPDKGHIKISDQAGKNEFEINKCIYQGFVSEKDQLNLKLHAVEKDCPDPDDHLTVYRRDFNNPPEAWVGRYIPGDEPSSPDKEAMSDWQVWYRIESLPLK